MIKNILSLLFFTVLPLLVSGKVIHELPVKENNRIYYIDPNGNDSAGDGSVDNPWASLAHACSQVVLPGNTIHVNPGTYNEGTNQSWLAVGVNIEGEGDSSCIISHYAGNDGSIRLYSPGPSTVDGNQKISYIKLDGELIATIGIVVYNRNKIIIDHCLFTRTLTTAFQTAITAWTVFLSDYVFSNCRTENTGTALFLVNIIGVEIYNCVFHEDYRQGEVTRVRWAYQCTAMKYHHNVSYKLANNLAQWNFTFEDWSSNGGNEIYENEFYGGGQMLDIAGVANVKGVYDYSYWVHDNIFKVTAIDHPYGWNNFAICFEGTNEYAIVNNNIFIDFDRPISIGVGQTPRYVKDIRIYYNIFQNSGGFFGEGGRNIQIINTQAGVTIEDIFIYNNVLSASNRLASNIYIQSPSEIKNIYIRNNIIENTNSNAFSYGWLMTACTDLHDVYVQSNILHNNYNNNQIVGSITNLHYNNNIIANPSFVTPGRDFHLRSDSPAINAGMKVGIDRDFNNVPVTWNPDIGAFEYALKLNWSFWDFLGYPHNITEY